MSRTSLPSVSAYDVWGGPCCNDSSWARGPWSQEPFEHEPTTAESPRNNAGPSYHRVESGDNAEQVEEAGVVGEIVAVSPAGSCLFHLLPDDEEIAERGVGEGTHLSEEVVVDPVDVTKWGQGKRVVVDAVMQCSRSVHVRAWV